MSKLLDGNFLYTVQIIFTVISNYFFLKTQQSWFKKNLELNYKLRVAELPEFGGIQVNLRIKCIINFNTSMILLYCKLIVGIEFIMPPHNS